MVTLTVTETVHVNGLLKPRTDLLPRMNRMDLNTYLYAPKDDYKHRLKWRDLYNEEEGGKGSFTLKESERESDFYCPQTKLREGYVFTPVCYSVHRGCVSQHAMGQGGLHPLDTHSGQKPPWTPPDTPGQIPQPPVEMTIEAGGTHLIGMQSCYFFYLYRCSMWTLKLDSLWTYLEAISLSLSRQYKWSFWYVHSKKNNM